MTEEEMNRLSDIIVDKLIEKQREYDKEFIKELKENSLPIDVHEKIPKKELLEIEVRALTSLLVKLEQSEQYIEAKECLEKIEFLKSEIKKLE
jgi:hypothetical protein